MCNMSGKKLSEDQASRIEELKKQWISEMDKIPEPKEVGWPDIKVNRPYRELEKKYMAKIKAIYEE